VTAAGVSAVLAALVAAAPGAQAATSIGVNCSTTSLQTAIDNAAPGATLDITGTCFGNFTIGTNLGLRGHGNAVLDGQGKGTTLTVSSGATVQVAHLTITDGDASGTAGDGGGINNSGTLTVDQSSIIDNSAGNSGGGIYSSADLTLVQTTVSGNSGVVFGGGIYNTNQMALVQSSVTNNSAEAGGGIFTGFGFAPVTLTDTTITNNTATVSGGGIFNILDSETLIDSAVSGNTAADEGGGITNNAGTTTLDNSTVTENSAGSAQAGSAGGGIFDFSATVSLNNSMVSVNTPDNCDPTGTVTGCTG
jgi:predicted outer membrane repeat protein